MNKPNLTISYDKLVEHFSERMFSDYMGGSNSYFPGAEADTFVNVFGLDEVSFYADIRRMFDARVKAQATRYEALRTN